MTGLAVSCTVAAGQDVVNDFDANDPGPSYYFSPQSDTLDVHLIGIYLGSNNHDETPPVVVHKMITQKLVQT
jgi:hypothetical protein